MEPSSWFKFLPYHFSRLQSPKAVQSGGQSPKIQRISCHQLNSIQLWKFKLIKLLRCPAPKNQIATTSLSNWMSSMNMLPKMYQC